MSESDRARGLAALPHLVRSSIAARLTLVTVLALTGTLAVLTAGLSLRLHTQAEQQAREQLVQLAIRTAEEAHPSFELPFQTARSLADAVVVLRRTGRPSRAVAESLIARAVARVPSAVGVWVEFDSQTFDGDDGVHRGEQSADGSGRFMPWYVRRDGVIRLQPTPPDYESGDFYWLPRKAGREMLMEPYKDLVGADSVLMTSVCVPFEDHGRFIAVAGADVALSDVQRLLATHRPLKTGYVGLVSRDGVYVGHPDSTRLGSAADDLPSLANAWTVLEQGGTFQARERDAHLGTEVERVYVPFRAGTGEQTWALVASVPRATVLAPARATTALLVAGMLLALVPIVFFTAWASRRVTGPLARSVEVLERVAGGDLTESIHVPGEDELARLATALNAAVRSTRAAMREASQAGHVMQQASQTHSAASEHLARHAREQADSVNATTANLVRVTGVIESNEQRAREADRAVGEAHSAASAGGDVVGRAISTMRDVEQGSARMSDIVTVIDEIAFRTTLLALNASVEAARAGEQGRGFGVVAQEVRTLAQRCAESATQIRVLIRDTGERVTEGAELVRRSGEHLERIRATVEQVREQMSGIRSSSRDQARDLNEIHAAVKSMDASVEQLTARAEEIEASAGDSAQAGAGLVAIVGRFQI